MPEEMTYSKAGVSIERENLAIKSITQILQKTFKFRKGKVGEVMQDIGTFANVIDMGPFALAMSTDGIGTKVLVAQELNKYDTVGIDMVAMNVNDVICLGAEPIAMVDYIAVRRIDPEVMRDISLGIHEGAKQADVAIVGGETATLPDVITGLGERGFDLAGTAIGVVAKDKIITGERIQVGDVVLGFKSTGIHSNGMSLARKILPKTMWLDLLTPTRIYVKEVMALVKEYDIHGLAHITGGGLSNMLRITSYGYVLDKVPTPKMTFKKIQELGKVSDKEMYKTFNMGIGFCVIVDEATGENIVKKYGSDWGISRIGFVVKEPGLKIIKEDGTEIFYGGYS